MDSVIKYVTNFFSGLLAIFMAVIPVSIVWYVLTGGAVFGIDVVANLSNLINRLGEGGFVGIVVLVLVVSFFTKKQFFILISLSKALRGFTFALNISRKRFGRLKKIIYI